jgi:hypothetical protein
MIVRLMNAKVLATSEFTYSPELKLHIEGVYKEQKYEFEHTFSRNSRESRLLLSCDMQTVNRLFNGGSYLFVDGILRDYRGSHFKGYQHGDKAIDALVERLGYSAIDPLKPGSSSINQNVRNRLNGAFLGNANWDSFELEIPNMGDGGRFTNKLVAAWSPFQKNVIINVDTLRLVCANGMVGEASAVTFQVPVVSDWETSLDIASRQLKPRVNAIMTASIEKMVDQRATIHDVNRAHDLLANRSFGEKGNESNKAQIQYLLRLTDVERHLRSYYSEAELKATQNHAHLTRYDVYNILTEASSHLGNDPRNDRAITGYLNEFVFGKEQDNIVHTGLIKVSDESDHNRAFFSSLNGKFKE